MKFFMFRDELFPYYKEDKECNQMEVPDDVVKRWRKFHKSFVKVQAEMERYYFRHCEKVEKAGPMCENGPIGKQITSQILDELIKPNP